MCEHIQPLAPRISRTDYSGEEGNILTRTGGSQVNQLSHKDLLTMCRLFFKIMSPIYT